MMQLYPLKFKPRFVEKIWGGRRLETVLHKAIPEKQLIGESWEIYDFPPGVIEESDDWVSAEIANGPLAGRTLHWAVGEFGKSLMGDVALVEGQTSSTADPSGQFPLLIKFLDAREDLSLQVHPNAEYARTHPGAHLKSEAWYVIENDPGTAIYKGITKGTTRESFAKAIADGTVMEQVVRIPVKPGDCHYLESGTVHALGAGVFVAEVQTPSDTTYRVFDFNRIEAATGKPRKLHVEQALDCIDFSGETSKPQVRSHVSHPFTTVTRLVTCPYFKMDKVRFKEGFENRVPYDEPVIWIMLDGNAEVKVDGMKDAIAFTKGETVLLPAEMKNPILKTNSDCVWLEVTFPTKKSWE